MVLENGLANSLFLLAFPYLAHWSHLSLRQGRLERQYLQTQCWFSSGAANRLPRDLRAQTLSRSVKPLDL